MEFLCRVVGVEVVECSGCSYGPQALLVTDFHFLFVAPLPHTPAHIWMYKGHYDTVDQTNEALKNDKVLAY